MTLLKPKVLRFDSLPSTNTELARMASEGAAEGLVILADEQTAGRGRLQRVWSSPKGAGLYTSILLRPQIPVDRWPLITFAAALAAGDALQEAAGVKTDIKWPNDLLSGERKICGILAEAIDTPGGRAVIVGIGINLMPNAFPEGTSVSEATGTRPDREAILAALLSAFTRWYSLLGEREKIVAAWSSRSSYATGKLVQVTSSDEVWQGTTYGVEPDGALRLRTSNGEIKLIRAGDVYSLRPPCGADSVAQDL
jgi:BirA family biotin operon repressor/biotin-[acetyl-CoA-carboxylase] ligase